MSRRNWSPSRERVESDHGKTRNGTEHVQIDSNKTSNRQQSSISLKKPTKIKADNRSWNLSKYNRPIYCHKVRHVWRLTSCVISNMTSSGFLISNIFLWVTNCTQFTRECWSLQACRSGLQSQHLFNAFSDQTKSKQIWDDSLKSGQRQTKHQDGEEVGAYQNKSGDRKKISSCQKLQT